MLKNWVIKGLIGITLASAPVAGSVGQYQETEPAEVIEVAYEVDGGEKYVGVEAEEEIDLSDIEFEDETVDVELDW